MAHGKTMLEMAKKDEPMTKNWVKVLKADMKLDGKEAKLKSKSMSKALKKKSK